MIIGISGKKGSGKDTIGKIIQYLTSIYLSNKDLNTNLYKLQETDTFLYNGYINWLKNKAPSVYVSSWKIVKFADKLKDVICLIIGCTREQLEDEEFKNTRLDKEWTIGLLKYSDKYDTYNMWFNNKEESIEYLDKQNCVYWSQFEMITLTPRMLLQQIGTDVCRNIHPNIWVNATMRDYKFIDNRSIQDPDDSNISYPNWVITDVRFPNEYDAIKEKNGIIIRVNRDKPNNKGVRTIPNTLDDINMHSSEISLDNHNFDYTIDNNATIDELIIKVKNILINESLI